MLKHTRVFANLLAIVALAQSQSVLSQESISRDPITGDYTISYFATEDNGNQMLRQTVFVPSTKISPSIRSEFEFKHAGSVAYRYTLKNGAGAPQAIQVFTLGSAVGVKTSSTASGGRSNDGRIFTPAPWTVLTSAKQNGLLRIVWRYPDAGGLWPTQAQPGFGFESTGLPGIVAAGVAGNAPDFAGLGENGFDPDSALGKQLQQLVMHDYVDVWVAAPAIPLTSPVNPTAVLTQLRTHVATWPSEQLIDQSTESNLDALFQAAIAALSQGNTQQAAQALRAVRRSIAPLHGEARDEDEGPAREKSNGRGGSMSYALAARVLSFDVRFLLHQLIGSGDD